MRYKLGFHFNGERRKIKSDMKRQTSRTPTRGEEGTSPKIWMETVDIAIDSGLRLGLTQ